MLECLRAGKRKARRLFLLQGGKNLDALEEAASGIPVDYLRRRDLDALVEGATHQGAVLEANPLPVLGLSDFLVSSIPSEATVVILDSVEDPQNFGAIVRSAVGLGAHAVLFAKDRSAPLSSVMVKAAAGGVEYIDLVQVTNLVRAMQELKDVGFWIAGLDAEAEQTIWSANLTGKTGVVIGSEGKGMRRLVRENCDLLLKIPLTGALSSLNASVSAAIALTECLRQRS